MTDKTVYSDDAIIDVIRTCADSDIAYMLTQLLNERDGAIKDLKALEAEVDDPIFGSADSEIDLTRSEKYEKE